MSTTQESTFYILLRVKGASTEKHATEHCTIASIGNSIYLRTKAVGAIREAGNVLSYPVTATITGTDLFGENKDIPVFLLTFPDKTRKEKAKKEFIEELWNTFDSKEYKEYTPHITLPPDSKFKWEIGDIIVFDSIYLSRYEDDTTLYETKID